MTTAKANERQVGGTHYQKNTVKCKHCGGELQHWDIYAAFPYLIGYLTKYLWRWRDKGGINDLEKAEHCMQKLLEDAKSEKASVAISAPPAVNLNFQRTVCHCDKPVISPPGSNICVVCGGVREDTTHSDLAEAAITQKVRHAP